VKRSNRLVILVGVLLAVLAFVGIVVVLNQQGGPPSQEALTETVLVATEDIDIGEEITPAKVETQQVEADAVLQTPLRDPSQVGGRPSRFAIPAGTQVTEEAVSLTEGGICIAECLEPGEKAISFQVDRVTGLDFLVQAGDYIDIVLAQQISVLQPTADSAANPGGPQRFEVVTGLENARSVKAILQNKRVLYVSATRARTQVVDPNATPAPEGQPAEQVIDSVIIVFAGSDQDAEAIKFAQRDLTELGSLTAVVRNAEDDEVEPTVGITIESLVETYGLRLPNILQLQETP
jgi:Flp pilus assembly protein CpaB